MCLQKWHKCPREGLPLRGTMISDANRQRTKRLGKPTRPAIHSDYGKVLHALDHAGTALVSVMMGRLSTGQ